MSALRLFAAAFAFALVLLPAEGAFAQARRQAEDCVLDKCGDAGSARRSPAPKPAAEEAVDKDNVIPGLEPGRRRGGQTFGSAVAPGNFDFYVLALSWSSGFCETRANGRAASQCDIGSNLGFVVHGLWPQNERGFPGDCDGARNPSQIALQNARGVFPDEGLARYEWRKHGTCSGKSPTDYFLDVKRTYENIEIPDEFKKVKSALSTSPQAIQRAFTDANPGLRPGMMSVSCQRGVLQEVRLCMTKDLRNFRPCPEVARSMCRSREITIPPMR